MEDLEHSDAWRALAARLDNEAELYREQVARLCVRTAGPACDARTGSVLPNRP